MTYRIAIGGFLHETNTFNPVKTTYYEFEQADCWPAITHGEQIFDTFQKQNIALCGYIHEARKHKVELVPLLWCSALPGGVVKQDAFKGICESLCYKLQQSLPVDAVFLDLHGAMVTEELEDAEGHLLQEVRKVVGDKVPIVVSLDYHANVTRAMFHHASLLTSYRQYPHTDIFETGQRAYQLTAQLIAFPHRYHFKAIKHFPRLIPLPWQSTKLEPAASIEAYIKNKEAEEGVSLSFCPGFPLADVSEVGLCFWGYGANEEHITDLIAEGSLMLTEKIPEFFGEIHSIEDAIHHYHKNASKRKCIIWADAQDNPGAGSDCASIAIAHAIIHDNMITTALMGVVYDPKAAKAALEKGPSQLITLAIGKNVTEHDPAPLRETFEIKAIHQTPVVGTGNYYKDCEMEVGPTIWLHCKGLDLVISSKPVQAADQAIFTNLGIKLEDYKLIVLKSAVHFRAAFEEIADEILVVESPGISYLDFHKLHYEHFNAKEH